MRHSSCRAHTTDTYGVRSAPEAWPRIRGITQGWPCLEASQKTAGICSGRLRDRLRRCSSYNVWRRCAKSGRVAVFCDRWSVHRSAAVAEYLAGHPDVRLIMLPKGSPYLNVVEECWNLGKHVVFRGIVYRKISELRHAISEYYRTVSFAHLCMYKYIYRSPVKALNYL